MFSRVSAALVALQVIVAAGSDNLYSVRRGPLYIRLPAPYSSSHPQCFDTQVSRFYDVGEVWSSAYSACKLNTCVNIGGVLHVERYSCPSVTKNVDFTRLKAGNLYCRQAWGNRNKAYPDCCPSLQCKHYVKGKLEPLPKHMYPYL
ncbi:uncharacterized protein LOC122394642 [Amphibalanus amphitrite]|uniref:uncharacterized protein LOC122394642 n=1 Tax=Amphibalanus amphitrite TaxID=1232801 RepID=UPI001C91D0AE|nr:uncharacterized protein LOC122394642 [Amphibalanus amphitrite]